MAEPFSHVSKGTNDKMMKASLEGHKKSHAKKQALAKKIVLKKGRGHDGSMEHKATGLSNTRRLLD